MKRTVLSLIVLVSLAKIASAQEIVPALVITPPSISGLQERPSNSTSVSFAGDNDVSIGATYRAGKLIFQSEIADQAVKSLKLTGATITPTQSYGSNISTVAYTWVRTSYLKTHGVTHGMLVIKTYQQGNETVVVSFYGSWPLSDAKKMEPAFREFVTSARVRF